MEIFKENLTLFVYLGLWKPSDWSSGNYRSVLYTAYTIFIIIMSSIFFITELLDLVLVTSNINEFTNNIFMLSAIFAGCLKIFILLQHRQVFNYTIDEFKNYLSKNDSNYEEEIDIWTRYGDTIKFLSMLFMSTTFFGVSMMTFATTSANIPRRELLYRAWVPYNYSRPVAYWVSAMGQLVTMYILAGVNTGFDLLFGGIMISICTQINIFKSRFKRHFSNIDQSDRDYKKINAPEIIGDFVKSYWSIKRLFETVHNLFSWVIMFQYSIGSIIFCTSAYNMSRMKVLSFEFLSCVLYVSNIMIELFIICYSSNEISLEFGKLHSAFYDCQWYLLNDYNKKSIGFMMTNSMKPVYFTCGYVIHLSLESFTNVIKLSYSIYNVLQSTF